MRTNAEKMKANAKLKSNAEDSLPKHPIDALVSFCALETIFFVDIREITVQQLKLESMGRKFQICSNE